MLVKLSASILVMALSAVPALAQPGPTLLIHGNYCGPGNNAPLAPIDALDAACARHDACSPDGALPSRACNFRLQRDAEAISRDPREPDDLRAMAAMVSFAASLMPSTLRNSYASAAMPPRSQPDLIHPRMAEERSRAKVHATRRILPSRFAPAQQAELRDRPIAQ